MTGRVRAALHSRAVRLTVVSGLVAVLAASAAPASVAGELPPYPGSLPDTASATDAVGRGEFTGLQLHVNQTTDLTTQAVSLSWNWPGRSTVLGSFPFGGNNKYQYDYLQVMQCWGEAVTTDATPADAANFVPDNPGPAREHCVYGGAAEKGIDALAPNGPTRVVERYTTQPARYGDESVYQASATGQAAEVPFTAANGTTVPHQLEKNDKGVSVYANEFFDRISTNEAPAGYTFADGTGGTQFQVQNAFDSRGLGCGAAAAAGGGLNRCWLVVVPRGERELTGGKLDPNSAAMWGSPLASTHWKDRIAIPLAFKPVATACAGGATTFPTLGSALVRNAMLSWQAKLCDTAGLTFNYSSGVDRRSRDDLASGTDAMEFLSAPADPSRSVTPITYAPVTLSGVSISFVWDEAVFNARTFALTPGRPLPTVKLDQRLVAKLVTYSYRQANNYRVGDNAQQRKPGPEAYTWLDDNPQWLGSDPEFLALNPELADLGKNTTLYSGGDPISSVQTSVAGSDGVAKLWQWIMSDQDAREFLAGRPAEPGGMQVDPAYNTVDLLNSNGAAFDPLSTDVLPNSDPWVGIPGVPEDVEPCPGQTTLGMIDIRPPASDSAAVARNILSVNPLEKWTGGYRCNSPDGPDGYFSSRPLGPVVPGFRNLMGVTDTASSRQYGLTTASLRNAAGEYVQPTTDSLTAAANHLAPTDVQGVVQPDLTVKDAAAYPLSLIAYAGVTTNGLLPDTCAAFATLLDYAAGAGQEPGTSNGDLPPGYAPLPTALRTQTGQAARTVAQCAQDVVPAEAPALSGDAPAAAGSGGGGANAAAAAAAAPATAPSAAAAAPGVSLAAASRTKPDPSVFAYVVPIAVLVGLGALLGAPLAGVRRRRTAGPPGPTSGS